MIPDHTVEISDGVNLVVFDVIAHVEDADYSWSAEAVLKRRPDGALFYFSDSGCSCYSFADEATVADLEPVFSMDEALRKADDRSNLEKSWRAGEVEYR